MRKPFPQSSLVTFIMLLLIVVALATSLRPVNAKAELQAESSQESVIAAGVRESLASMNEDEMITVIVTMRSQADLSGTHAANRPDRINQIIKTLKNQANAAQHHIHALLESRKYAGDVAEYRSLWIFNGLIVTAKARTIEELAARPEIAMITANEVDAVEAGLTELSNPESNLSVVNAPALWNLGFRGQGIVVASMDSGVDYAHPDLSLRWRGGSNSWFDPYGQHPIIPTDRSGHGTWTMGVMVGGDGGGTSIGIAPEAQWIAAKIFDDNGSATAAAIHAAFQWMLDPDGDPGTADTPHVINNSWNFASGGCDLQFELDLQALRAAGVLPVFAAGNAGPYAQSSRSPANNPSAFAVGATTDNDAIYFQSSRGPSSCGELETIFPEMVAPGVDIYTSDLYGFYYSATGTSLAAPHVSGALALLLSYDSGLSATLQQDALLNGAADLGVAGPDNDYGYGRLDILASYQWLLGNGVPTPTPTPVPGNTNLALYRPVFVSSVEDASHAGDFAVDGDMATYWQTARAKGKNKSTSESITVDLGSSISVGRVVLEWAGNFATAYSIQLSTDNVNWTSIFSTAAGDGGNDSVLFGPFSARYVKMESTAWSDGSLRNWLREFEVYEGGGGPTPTPTPTPAPSPTPTPGPTGNLHSGDLDGSSAPGGRNRWDATVVITIHDDNELAVSGATVSGVWSSGASGGGSCVTDVNGTCTVSKNNLQSRSDQVTFAVDSVSHPTLQYLASANHDPDGDSDGSSITVSKP